MTRAIKYRRDEHKKVFIRDNFICQICNKWVGNQKAQSAHKIPNTEPNIKDYGYYVINSHLNQKCVCSLECNKKAEMHAKEYGQQAIDDMLLVIGMTVKKKGLPIGKKLQRIIDEDTKQEDNNG